MVEKVEDYVSKKLQELDIGKIIWKRIVSISAIDIDKYFSK